MNKILIVNDERMTGGVSILLEDILNNLNNKEKIDLLILHDNGDRLKNLPSNINIIYGTPFFNVVDLNIKEVIKTKKLSLIIKKIYLVFLMKTGLIKNKIIKERKKLFKEPYDVEIAFKDGFCGLFTAYGDSKEKIQWIHTDYSKKDYLEKYRNIFIKVFNLFDKFIAVSNPVKDNFNNIYGQKEKTIVINNLVDDKKIIDLSKKEKINLSDKKINLISVGRLHYDKGFHVLLNVLNRLNKDSLLNDVHYTLVGDGPEYDNLKRLIEEYNLEDKVSMVGNQPNPFTYVKASDMFILSSFHESFGNVMIEALILGVPVLATRVATIDEILDEKNGMKVENSEEGLYKGLKKILKNPKMIQEYKTNLKKYKYPNDKIIKEITELFK